MMRQPLHGIGSAEEKTMRFNLSNDNYAEAVTPLAPIETQYDDSAGLEKTFTVPNGETWEICWAHIELTTSATVGNRLLRIYVYDEDGNRVIDFFPPATQAASLTNHYAFLQGIYRETAFASGAIQVPIPKDFFMTAGFSVSITDDNSVDLANDDSVVSFQYKRYKGVI